MRFVFAGMGPKTGDVYFQVLIDQSVEHYLISYHYLKNYTQAEFEHIVKKGIPSRRRQCG